MQQKTSKWKNTTKKYFKNSSVKTYLSTGLRFSHGKYVQLETIWPKYEHLRLRFYLRTDHAVNMFVQDEKYEIQHQNTSEATELIWYNFGL